MLDFSYRPGLRAVKTALAVFLCLAVEALLGRTNPFYGCIAAVVCMLPTYRQTFHTGLNRMIGTLAGGLFGYLLLEASRFLPYYNDGVNLLLVPAVMLGVIYLLNVLGIQGAISIGCIVFLGITVYPGRSVDNALLFVVNRMIDTLIGILIAMIVNRVIAPRRSLAPEPPDAKELEALDEALGEAVQTLKKEEVRPPEGPPQTEYGKASVEKHGEGEP